MHEDYYSGCCFGKCHLPNYGNIVPAFFIDIQVVNAISLMTLNHIDFIKHVSQYVMSYIC